MKRKLVLGLCVLLLGQIMLAEAAKLISPQAEFDKAIRAISNRDFSSAFQIFAKLAKLGDGASQFNLGLMYEKGEGVPQDYKMAAYWYTRAANQGFVSAQFSLGVMYAKGEGVPQDYVTALMWFNLAAAGGYEEAKHSLETLEKGMTPKQISKGKEMAARWRRPPTPE